MYDIRSGYQVLLNKRQIYGGAPKVKCYRKFKSNIGDLKTVKKDGHYDVIDNDVDKANALGDFFLSIYTREPDDAFAELPTQNPPSPFEEVRFSDEDILERLSEINI